MADGKVTVIERPNKVSIVSNLVPVDRSSADKYVNLTANKTLENADNRSIFSNTGAGSIVAINFSNVGVNRSFEFLVTDAIGFNLIPTGTFFIAGQQVTGAISSTTVGSRIKATVINSTQIFIQSDGVWSYE